MFTIKGKEKSDTCQICGREAHFDIPPEGDNCDICGRWICPDCLDSEQWGYETSFDYGVDFICEECADDLKDLEMKAEEHNIDISAKTIYIEQEENYPRITEKNTKRYLEKKKKKKECEQREREY